MPRMTNSFCYLTGSFNSQFCMQPIGQALHFRCTKPFTSCFLLILSDISLRKYGFDVVSCSWIVPLWINTFRLNQWFVVIKFFPRVCVCWHVLVSLCAYYWLWPFYHWPRKWRNMTDSQHVTDVAHSTFTRCWGGRTNRNLHKNILILIMMIITEFI